jgi:predicted nucleic acid-binding protein
MYAIGEEHPLRDPCQRVLRRAAERRIDAVTSAEVVQEILHRYLAVGRPDIAISAARGILTAFGPVMPVTHEVVSRVADLAERYSTTLSARDLVHAATCIEHGIDEIVTTDRGFDHVAELTRIDPVAFAA